ncbi:HpcH/HpaI aldolase/citrate lyase family protein [Salinibacillus xinjiangensis]|uniref:CoA ester lyase n=1 Tax=Salinibacillus xinjiangensis TaxID=1229268 RepID=A0A6G1X1G2_9BACI|nr:CoA ester lyase [Salinibacillus xinjiangensis]MRG84831.1 CoA ester lyase [Salinibacillus xinjiangensis]
MCEKGMMLLIISWLFIPGSQDKFLNKVKDVNADAFIFDLEDSVSNQDKKMARIKVSRMVQSFKQNRNYIRVNAISTEYFLDDLYETVTEGLSGIVLPKVNAKNDIVIVDYLLSAVERKIGLKEGTISVVPIIENALGLRNAFEIATSSERVKQLAFGAEDFMLDLNVSTEERKNGMTYVRSKLVADSRAANIEPPIDAIYPDFKNEEGFKLDVEMGKQLGFQGKLLIHPKQIPVVTEIYAPTPEELDEAKRIVTSYEQARQHGLGSIEVDGKMVDIPVAERAKRILSYVDSSN